MSLRKHTTDTDSEPSQTPTLSLYRQLSPSSTCNDQPTPASLRTTILTRNNTRHWLSHVAAEFGVLCFQALETPLQHPTGFTTQGSLNDPDISPLTRLHSPAGASRASSRRTHSDNFIVMFQSPMRPLVDYRLYRRQGGSMTNSDVIPSSRRSPA